MIPYLQAGNYYGVEPERWLVDEGIRRETGRDQIDLKRPQFRYVDDFSFSAFGREFDFLIAQSIFSHASRQQIGVCMREAVRVMTSESVFVATFVEGESDAASDEWLYPGCLRYRRETLFALAEEAGLTAIVLDWRHPNGQTWLSLSRIGPVDGVPGL